MMLLEAVKKIEAAGMKVRLEADARGYDLMAYVWSDERDYECKLTLQNSIYDRLDEDEVALLERVIARNAA
jgi:hypothetical protein